MCETYDFNTAQTNNNRVYKNNSEHNSVTIRRLNRFIWCFSIFVFEQNLHDTIPFSWNDIGIWK